MEPEAPMKSRKLRLIFQISTVVLAVSCYNSTGLSGDGSADQPGGEDNASTDPSHDRGRDDGGGPDAQEVPPPLCPSVNWTDVLFEFQADGRIVSTPAVGSDGTVYFGTENATLYALDCFGRLKWQWKYDCVDYCPQAFEGSPAVGDDGTIFIGDDIATPNYFFAVTPDGVTKWKYETLSINGQMDASPAIAQDGTIYVGSRGYPEMDPMGQLVALRTDGSILENFPIPTKAIEGSPAAVGTIAYVGHTGMNGLSLLNSIFSVMDTGDKLWERLLTQAGDYVWEDISLSSLAVDSEARIVVAENFETSRFSHLVLLDRESGGVMRTIELGDGAIVVGAPVIGRAYFGEDIIVALDTGRLISANPDSGGVIFTFDLELGTSMTGSPVLGDDDHVYAAAGSRLYRITKQGDIPGNIQNPITLSDTVTSSLAMGRGGVLYMGTESGKLIAAGTGAGGLDQAAPWPSFRHDERNTGRATSLDCDGLHGIRCPDETYFCEHPSGVCFSPDAMGTCIRIPDPSYCPDFDICPDVCGCDGMTYCSDCERRAVGISKAYDGPCG
jgi:outer membrane protein assembly factor BamB